jgi:hypothetical protein
MGYRKLSARPRHHAQAPGAVLAVSCCQRPAAEQVSPMLFPAVPIGGLPTRHAIWRRSR